MPRLFATSPGLKSVPIMRRQQRWLERGRLIRLACRRVWRNVARQSKPSSRVAAPIVMIPALDVESILRTWTPDSPYDIPLKGAQAASRQPSQPSQPTRPAYLPVCRPRRGAIFTRVRSARVMHACHLSSSSSSSSVFRFFFSLPSPRDPSPLVLFLVRLPTIAGRLLCRFTWLYVPPFYALFPFAHG